VSIRRLAGPGRAWFLPAVPRILQQSAHSEGKTMIRTIYSSLCGVLMLLAALIPLIVLFMDRAIY
jgi:hypothetical protein